MAVNLLRRHDLRQAEALLGASFAQFEADESVTRKADRLDELEEGLAGYARHLTCELGDWEGYWRLRRTLSRREKEEAKARKRASEEAVRDALVRLQPGDVLHLPWTGRRGLVAVVGVHLTKKGTPLAQVVADDRALTKVGPRELDGPPEPIERIRLPRKGNPRQKEYRRDVAVLLRGLEPPGVDLGLAPDDEPPAATTSGLSAEVEQLREEVRAHACHGCPDRAEHERWQYRADELSDQADSLRSSIQRATGSLVRQLHRILRVLEQLGYVEGVESGDPEPTEEGLRLAGIYSEVDLLVAEAVRRGYLDELDPAELAGIAALFLYEPRGGELTEDPELPTMRLYETVEDILALVEELREHERAAGVRPVRDLDAGFVAAAWRWSSGADLDEALGDLELTGGDFVRNVKQVADLVGQLRTVGGGPLRSLAEEALDGLRRGIVEA
jgi:ATP-dependent RNA helicase HelY